MDRERLEERNIISKTGNNVLAPVLNSFVLHVLTEAKKNGIKTLFFLARDAYLITWLRRNMLMNLIWISNVNIFMFRDYHLEFRFII